MHDGRYYYYTQIIQKIDLLLEMLEQIRQEIELVSLPYIANATTAIPIEAITH